MSPQCTERVYQSLANEFWILVGDLSDGELITLKEFCDLFLAAKAITFWDRLGCLNIQSQNELLVEAILNKMTFNEFYNLLEGDSF